MSQTMDRNFSAVVCEGIVAHRTPSTLRVIPGTRRELRPCNSPCDVSTSISSLPRVSRLGRHHAHAPNATVRPRAAG
jgi:hypothetical protein